MEEKKVNKLTDEQRAVLENKKQNLIVSASAGSGKTHTMIEYLSNLIIKKKIPVKKILVLTFTKAAASEMKSRLEKKLKEQKFDKFILQQIDDLSIANICTIDAYCEKLVKRYINLLPINAGFEIYEPKKLNEIKTFAFNFAFEKFKEENKNEYFEIFNSYRSNLDNVKKIMDQLENIMQVIVDPEKFFEELINNQSEMFDKALEIIFEDIKNEIKYCKERYEEIRLSVEKQEKYFDNFINICNYILNEDDIFNLSKTIIGIDLPRNLSLKQAGEFYDELKYLKDKKVSVIFNKITNLNLSNKELVQKQRENKLVIALLKLFKNYSYELDEIKRKRNIISISDLEKYASIICSQNLEEIQDNFEYVFVDEYQDTNKVQENLIRSIAGKSNFFAVGDAKQGIYGFRLASSDIILNTMEDFKNQENGDSLTLSHNFRTDKVILDFINFVFEKIMTKESCKIDYKENTITGEKNFEKGNLPSIRVDVAKIKKEQKELASGMYSVLEDEIESDDENTLESEIIQTRIEELLQNEIYDEKLDSMRKVEYKDIAVLFRKRNKALENLEACLIKKHIPVISDTKRKFFDEPENIIILNFLKVALSYEDDIALASCLVSPFGSVTLSELANIKMKYQDKLFYEKIILEKDSNEKIKEFFDIVDEFNYLYNQKGIYFALNRIFDNVNFYAYIKAQNDGENKYNMVSYLLSDILQSGYNYDLANLINYLESVENSVSNNNSLSNNSVLLTTIHGTKGLEYPIVILADCGSSFFGSGDKLEIEIDETFGLATKIYDKDENQKFSSVQMQAIKTLSKKSDFAQELMIFYVALTRAKNLLLMSGVCEENKLEKKEKITDCSTYFDLIFYCLTDAQFDEFVHNENIKVSNCEFSLIDEVENININQKDEFIIGNYEQEDFDKIKEYLEFEYKDKDFCKMNFKNSVTQILQTESHKKLTTQSYNEELAEEGILYHEILRQVNFEDINTKDDVVLFLQKKFKEEFERLNIDIIFNNIMLLKKLSQNKKVYKERSFILQEELKNIKNTTCKENCLIQGLVDLFLLGEENILIDYKFTNIQDDEKILERYKTQLVLYKLAIEKGYNVIIDKIFILSLKNSKLIELLD